MKLLQEFKEFAVKGNMIDIAIGVIIGASFNKVIDVLVKQVLMPPLSILTGGTDYANQKYVLQEASKAADGSIISQEIAIHYGLLFGVLIDFLIIGITVFLVVKLMNQLKNKAQDVKDKTVKTPKDIELLNKMTELLEKQNELLASKTG
jgi:large conductance mechanosensitive channel